MSGLDLVHVTRAGVVHTAPGGSPVEDVADAVVGWYALRRLEEDQLRRLVHEECAAAAAREDAEEVSP